MRISLVVPAYNEAPTIGRVLKRIAELPIDYQIVVVDDGSDDGTAVEAEAAIAGPFVCIRHEANLGKGAAIRSALPHIDGEIVVIQDADAEYDPADVPALVQPIIDGYADVVYGSRLLGGKPQRAFLFWHFVGNRVLSGLTDVLYNTTITDMETGYKAFRSDVLRGLDLREDRFGIEPELTAQVCKQKLRIYEVPVSYYGRTYAEGKKITWRDGLRAIAVLLRVRVRRRSAGVRA